MNLTSAQLSALNAHLQANTNTATAPDGSGGFTINTVLAGRDPTLQSYIANWYNGTALAGDAEPFSNLRVWNPLTTIAQIKSALATFTPSGGASGAVLQATASPTDAQVTNALLMFQVMIWDLGPPPNSQLAILPAAGLDFGDPQVRAGVLAIFGDIAAGNAHALGASGCGQQVGKRIELVLSNTAVGASAGSAFTNAHPIQKDAGGVTIYGQKLTQLDVDKALFPNG